MEGEALLKMKVQRWILIVSVLIFMTKLTTFFYTASIGILSDALESTVNVFTGFMTLFSLQYSLKPKDVDHPYGHGKIELITASVEGLLIGIAGFYILYEAILRFFEPSEIHNLGTGVILIAACGALNYVLAVYSMKIGREYKSMALVAGGQHLKTDTYTSLGLILGLVLVLWTGITWIDSIVAIIFAIIIWKGAYDILRHTTMGLMDKVDMSMLNDLVAILSKNRPPQWIYGHKLTLLHFGHVIHVDLHLTLPYYFTLQQSLDEVRKMKGLMINHLEKEQLDISIQTEPCHPGLCSGCTMDCPVRSVALQSPMDWDVQELTMGNKFKHA